MFSQRKLNGDMEKGPKNDTDGGRVNTKTGGKKENADDGTEVVKQRRNRRYEEASLRLKNASKKSREGKK